MHPHACRLDCRFPNATLDIRFCIPILNDDTAQLGERLHPFQYLLTDCYLSSMADVFIYIWSSTFLRLSWGWLCFFIEVCHCSLPFCPILLEQCNVIGEVQVAQVVFIRSVNALSNAGSCTLPDIVKGDKEEEREQDAALSDTNDLEEVCVAACVINAATWPEVQIPKNVNEYIWHAVEPQHPPQGLSMNAVAVYYCN